MRYTKQSDTYVIRFEDEEKVPDRFLAFLSSEGISAGSFTAIGALRRTRIAFFDTNAKEYQDIDLDEQMEVLALIGNVALYDGEPLVHAHITLGRRDGTTLGGHLRHGIVCPTLEMMLRVLPEPIHRAVDPKYGLPGVDLPTQ